jgi:CRISPR-associated exonuclease Cas4
MQNTNNTNDLPKIQGIKVNYYFICKRKLWLFAKGLGFENLSERVSIGKILHETAYPREKEREILIDDTIMLDLASEDYIREIKLSSKMEEADKMQVYYYLYFLKQKGIIKKGMINYVKEKRREEIELTDEIEQKIKFVLDDIIKICEHTNPPEYKKLKYCTKCAYYEFCLAGE